MKKCAALITSTLCIGILVLQAPASYGQNKMAKAQAIAAQLNLTPEQKAKILPILAEEGPKLEAIKNNQSLSNLQKMQQISALHQQTDPQMKAILSPVQYEKLKTIRQKAIEDARDELKAGEVFYYADEFNVSWLPTLRKMWSPKGQQVMIPTPGQPKVHYGLGAVNYHTGETVVIIRKRKRRLEVAELLQTLLAKHPNGTIYLAWDNASTHQDDEVEAVIRAAAGRLVLLYLPTYSPWLNPIEMLWRHFRREVTHCELFETVKVLIEASYDFFRRYNQTPDKVLSIIGAYPP